MPAKRLSVIALLAIAVAALLLAYRKREERPRPVNETGDPPQSNSVEKTDELLEALASEAVDGNT
jgi:hypothetical protein